MLRVSRAFTVPVQAEIANHHPQPGWEFRASPGLEGTQAAKPLFAEPLAHVEKAVGHGISFPLEKLHRLKYVRRVRFQEVGLTLLGLLRGQPFQNSRNRRIFHYCTLLTRLENTFAVRPSRKT
jgi:hypothetical protein